MLTVVLPTISVGRGTWNSTELQMQSLMVQEAEALDWLMATGLQGWLDVHANASLQQSLHDFGILWLASLVTAVCVFLAARMLLLLRLASRAGSHLYEWLLPSAKHALRLAAAERRRAAAVTIVACTSLGQTARAAGTRRRALMEGIVEALRVEREAHKRCDFAAPLISLPLA